MSVPDIDARRADRAEPAPGSPPHATVTATFLATDIEGSTRLWTDHRDAMGNALAGHDALLREAVAEAGGRVFKSTGDGVLAVFERPGAALAAARVAQRRLDAHYWPGTGPLRVRMAIHAGDADLRDGDYFGPTVNRLARLLAIGHGGQVLVSSVAAGLAEEDLPADVTLVDRGEHRLRDLDRPEHVFQLVAPELRADFPPLRSATPRTNLPPELTSFVGRERELEEVRSLLARHRLVTLVGVGGTGKTRLMLHLGGELADAHADGAWLVELAPIADPALVVPAVARALDVPILPGRPELDTVVDFLREKDLLLLLDNCEHLIDAAASLSERLLLECPSLRILATSREALGIAGESTVPIPSLGLPPAPTAEAATASLDLGAIAAAESVRLFVERATAMQPDFTLDPSTAAPVVEICRRLDGIPLALELAAARVNVLSVAEIAEGLGDRFRLLTGGRRTAVPRQQTLQALIDWSWDLLTEADQRLLRRLSVFAGGWTLDAAAEVTSEPASAAATSSAPPPGPTSGTRLETLDGLGRLIDRSLVIAEHGPASRYRMLETIRQYANDRLIASGEAAALRTRHLARFRRLALDAAPGIRGPDAVAWLELLDTELDNLRSAMDWASETDVDSFVEMAVAHGQYWRLRSIGTEGMDRLLQAIEAARRLPEPAPDERPQRAAMLTRLLATAATVGAATNRRLDAVGGWADEAVELAAVAADPLSLSLALGSRFLASVFTGRDPADETLARAEAVVSAAEANGDWWSVAQAAGSIAMYVVASDPGAGDRWIARATEAGRRSGSPFAIAFAEMGQGQVLGFRGRVDEARPHFEESLARFCDVGDVRMQLVIRSDIGHALRRSGRRDDALAEYRQTIVEWQRLGQRGAIANQLESFAYIALDEGDAMRAATLLAAADRLREESGAVMLAPERLEYDQARARLAEWPDAAAIERASAEGRALSTDEVVALAIAG